MNNQLLIEMALSRLDAMDRCISYGERFCDHFNLVCKNGLASSDFKHHCGELQGWFKTIKKIKTKSDNKELKNEDLIDWFFTAGQNIEDVIQPEYVETYKKFIDRLLANNDQLISDILIELLS